MQTNLADFIKDTPQGREADAILRKCVHCGFCTATCPTYQLLGDELDSPRGRIYLIKSMLEGNPVGESTRLHLDRCLSCRSCETTCPSGVSYAKLLDIGRETAERLAPRTVGDRIFRRALRLVLPYPSRFTPLFRMGQMMRPLLPKALAAKVLPARKPGKIPATSHSRRVLVLDGCAQRGMAPSINAAAARVLDRLGISVIREPRAGCCGALSLHLSASEEALNFVRGVIDSVWPHIETGIEAIVSTASGCGVMVEEYGDLLSDDSRYAEKARKVSEMTVDIAELVHDEIDHLERVADGDKVAFHAPCTLQHGLKIPGLVESVLTKSGFTLSGVPNSHLCCGSAGTYSLLQPKLSQQLKYAKIAALESGGPDLIATANIGCLAHLSESASVEVRHWIELLDRFQESPTTPKSH